MFQISIFPISDELVRTSSSMANSMSRNSNGFFLGRLAFIISAISLMLFLFERTSLFLSMTGPKRYYAFIHSNFLKVQSLEYAYNDLSTSPLKQNERLILV